MPSNTYIKNNTFIYVLYFNTTSNRILLLKIIIIILLQILHFKCIQLVFETRFQDGDFVLRRRSVRQERD